MIIMLVLAGHSPSRSWARFQPPIWPPNFGGAPRNTIQTYYASAKPVLLGELDVLCSVRGTTYVRIQ